MSYEKIYFKLCVKNVLNCQQQSSNVRIVQYMKVNNEIIFIIRIILEIGCKFSYKNSFITYIMSTCISRNAHAHRRKSSKFTIVSFCINLLRNFQASQFLIQNRTRQETVYRTSNISRKELFFLNKQEVFM